MNSLTKKALMKTIRDFLISIATLFGLVLLVLLFSFAVDRGTSTLHYLSGAMFSLLGLFFVIRFMYKENIKKFKEKVEQK